MATDPEATAPPVPPQKWRRAWLLSTRLVASYPDMALAAFMLLLAVAIVFGVLV